MQEVLLAAFACLGTALSSSWTHDDAVPIVHSVGSLIILARVSPLDPPQHTGGISATIVQLPCEDPFRQDIEGFQKLYRS